METPGLALAKTDDKVLQGIRGGEDLEESAGEGEAQKMSWQK